NLHRLLAADLLPSAAPQSTWGASVPAATPRVGTDSFQHAKVIQCKALTTISSGSSERHKPVAGRCFHAAAKATTGTSSSVRLQYVCVRNGEPFFPPPPDVTSLLLAASCGGTSAEPAGARGRLQNSALAKGNRPAAFP